MATEIKQTELLSVREKIELACLEVEKATNFEIIAEIKAMLNSMYGEERNQIAKPTFESIMGRAADIGNESDIVRRLQGLSTASHVHTYLSTAIADLLSYQIIIHFPEITIKNNTQQHTIRDIYVRLFLRPNGTVSTYIQGMRTTITEAEYLSRYLHSHLPLLSTGEITFHSFCLGVGEINQLLMLLSSKFTSANFMMLLAHIKNFLEWESKEGHPYAFMENVFTRSSNMRTHNNLPDHIALRASRELLSIITTTFTMNEIVEMFNFSVSERGIKANPTPELEKRMANIIEGWDIPSLLNSSYDSSYFLSLKDNNGDYYALPTEQRRINHTNLPILNFKGRDIQFQVIERSQTQRNETYANPKITEQVCKELSRTLTKTALSSPGIKSGSSLVHNSRVTESDKVSL